MWSSHPCDVAPTRSSLVMIARKASGHDLSTFGVINYSCSIKWASVLSSAKKASILTELYPWWPLSRFAFNTRLQVEIIWFDNAVPYYRVIFARLYIYYFSVFYLPLFFLSIDKLSKVKLQSIECIWKEICGTYAFSSLNMFIYGDSVQQILKKSAHESQIGNCYYHQQLVAVSRQEMPTISSISKSRVLLWFDKASVGS